MARLTRLFIDAATENVDALPRRLAELGVRYPKEREEEFRTELRELYYRYFGASLAEIDPIQVIREAFGLIYSMNLQLPTRFVLLDKAIATLGAVGVDLYPEFNVFEVARPYARELMLERFSPARLVTQAQREGRELIGIARELPYQIHDVLQEMRDGQIEVGFVHKGLDEFMHKLDVAINRVVVALVVAGGLLGSSLIGILATDGPQIFGIHFLSVIGFVVSGALGVWLLVGVLRSGRALGLQGLDRAADGQARLGAACEHPDPVVDRHDAEAVTRRGEVGEPRPAARLHVVRVHASDRAGRLLAADRDDAPAERRRARAAARSRQGCEPAPALGRRVVDLEGRRVRVDPGRAAADRVDPAP